MIVVLALAGGLGAVCRWLLSRYNDAWPVGTFVANVSGSLLLGLLVGLEIGEVVGLLLSVGFLGGFTTFSTFALEVVGEDKDGTEPHRPRVAYAVASAVAGCAAAGGGLLLGLAL